MKVICLKLMKNSIPPTHQTLLATTKQNFTVRLKGNSNVLLLDNMVVPLYCDFRCLLRVSLYFRIMTYFSYGFRDKIDRTTSPSEAMLVKYMVYCLLLLEY